MILLLAIVFISCDNHVDAHRGYIVQSRPSSFKFQNTFHHPQITFGGRGWGNKGFVNSGWGNHAFGNSVWRNNGVGNIGFNNFGSNIWRNNGFGIGTINPWRGNNGGLGHFGNVLLGNQGFNLPNIIVVRPGPFGGIQNGHGQGHVIDVKIPPPKPNVLPKEDAKPVVIPEESQTSDSTETDGNNNQQFQENGQGEMEPVVKIPTDENPDNQEQFNKQNDNFGDTAEAENNAAEENSQEENNNENSENSDNTDENTAAEVSENVTDENKESDTKNEDHDSGSKDENESLPDLTGVFDVRTNLKIGNKNKAKDSEINSNAINRRNDNTCGIPGTTTQPRAVDKATLLPWLVTLGKVENSTFYFLCGGSLISSQSSDDLILSSAHCFHNEVPTVAKIGDEFIPIAKTVLHEKYNISQAYNNIALVKLSRPVNSTLAACLPNQISSSVDKHGMEATALEWKKISSDELPKPDAMTTKILPNSQCVKDYENEHYASYFPKGFDSTLLCVKLQMPFVCQGDSGIQLFSVDEETDVYTLIGTIANPETSCGGTDYPGIYTKVSSFLPWIEEISGKLRS